MTVSYCSNDDVFLLGLSAQAFVVRPRPVIAATEVDGTTGRIRLKAHGLTAADIVTFEVTSGGALPTGVSAFVPYYPVIVGFDLFQIATTPNGTPLTFASTGAGWGIVVDPLRRIARHALEVSAEIDNCLTAHATPLNVDTNGKYPEVVVGVAARMTARAAVTSLQIENAQYKVAVDRLFAKEEFDKMTLAEWKAGKPVTPTPVDQDTLADNAPRAGRSRAPVCWTIGRLS